MSQPNSHLWLLSTAGSTRAIEYPAVTLDQLVDHVGIDKDLLNRPCSDATLTKVAIHIPNWQKYGEALGLRQPQILGIKSDHVLDPEMKAQQVLKLWKQENGFRATYAELVQVYLQMRNVQLAEWICQMIKGKLGVCVHVSSWGKMKFPNLLQYIM